MSARTPGKPVHGAWWALGYGVAVFLAVQLVFLLGALGIGGGQ